MFLAATLALDNSISYDVVMDTREVVMGPREVVMGPARGSPLGATISEDFAVRRPGSKHQRIFRGEGFGSDNQRIFRGERGPGSASRRSIPTGTLL